MDTSPNFFDVLGVGPAAGRLYSQADDGHLVAVVSHNFWARRLYSDSNAIGRALHLNGRVYTVVGVLPREYRSVMRHGMSPEIYAPVLPDSQARCRPFARMREGISRAQARAAWTAAVGRFGGSEISRAAYDLRPLGGLGANAESKGDDR